MAAVTSATAAKEMPRCQECTPLDLFNSLLWEYLVIDLRSEAEFLQDHFERAQSLASGLAASQRGEVRPFDPPELADCIFLYSGERQTAAEDPRVLQALSLCMQSFRRPRSPTDVKVFLVRGGFAAIREQLELTCTGSPECTPGLIYPQFVPCFDGEGAVGIAGEGVAQDVPLLLRLGVTHVVNCTPSVPNYGEDQGLLYHRVEVEDTPMADIGRHLHAAVAFISAAHLGGGKVFVHCARGVSRSASVVIACLIQHEGLGVQDAVAALQRARGVCSPNEGFLRQLRSYEASRRSRTTQ